MPGPEFHQTVMGRRFFEGQLPRLIDRLDRIATALEKIEARMKESESGKEPD